MTERTGRLKARTLVMTWKMYDNIPGNDRHFYSEAGSPVRWDGVSSNAGYEDFYGGRRLLWTDVWNEELAGWMGRGLAEDKVEWDD